MHRWIDNMRLFLVSLFFVSFAWADNRIGLFIASVDPITVAHTEVITVGIKQLKLNKIIVLVNTSSDKDYSASVAERIELTQIALEKIKKEYQIDYEVLPEPKEGKQNFAIRTAREQGDGLIYQIAGEDVQPKAKDLFSNVKEVKSYILPRLNSNEEVGLHQTQLLEGFSLLESTQISSISSTEVKYRLENNLEVSSYLDASVLNAIQQKNLYQPLSDADALKKGQRLYQQMKQYIAAIQNSLRWSALNTLTLNPGGLEHSGTFTLRKGVSTSSNLTFNRTQSEEASLELMTRLILKLNPTMSSAHIYDFKNWSQNVLKNKCEALFEPRLN